MSVGSYWLESTFQPLGVRAYLRVRLARDCSNVTNAWRAVLKGVKFTHPLHSQLARGTRPRQSHPPIWRCSANGAVRNPSPPRFDHTALAFDHSGTNRAFPKTIAPSGSFGEDFTTTTSLFTPFSGMGLGITALSPELNVLLSPQERRV